MVKDLGIGLIGIHGLGKTVGPINEDSSSRLSVRSVCCLEEDQMREFADQWNVPHRTTRFQEVLARDDVHIIGIYTPDSLHAEMILQALDAGKHVVVTKPMVNTMEEVEQVVAAVRKSGKKLLVGETVHFDLPNVAAKRLVDSGRIGKPIFIQSSYIHDIRPVIAERPWRLDPTNKIWLVGSVCHPLDFQMWFGGDVDEVSAYANDGGTIAGRKGANNFIVNLKFKEGAIGRVLGLYGVVHPPQGCSPSSVFCTKGSIVGRKYTVDSPGSPHGVQEFDLEIDERDDDKSQKGHAPSVNRYLKHLEDCILNDKTPCCDVIVGAKTTAISWAAQESIDTGRSVKVRNEF